MNGIKNCPKCGTNWRKGVRAMTFEGEILTLCPKDGLVMGRQYWPPLFYSKEKIMAQLERTAINYINGQVDGLAACAMLEAHDWMAYQARREAKYPLP